MKQGVLPFQYEQEKSSPGMTAMAGMMTYLELMHAAGLRSSVERHVGLRECGQGWTDSQVVSSLILLNLAGGESVVDLDVLEKDAGLCRVLREVESYGMGRRERRALEERWRVDPHFPYQPCWACRDPDSPPREEEDLVGARREGG